MRLQGVTTKMRTTSEFNKYSILHICLFSAKQRVHIFQAILHTDASYRTSHPQLALYVCSYIFFQSWRVVSFTTQPLYSGEQIPTLQTVIE
jgi:hypothetical protein